MKASLAIVIAYILGSIPFGYLIVRAWSGADIRESGSGGTGATNVSRRAGKLAGLVTLVLDAAKGAVAVLLVRWWLAPGDELIWSVGFAALAVIVGHIFPIWLGFRGGKGVATSVGVFLALAPFIVVLAGFVFLTTVLLTRYVSLASILAAAFIPLCIWVQLQFGRPYGGSDIMLFTAAVAATLIVFAHRSNIARLIRGTETRFH